MSLRCFVCGHELPLDARFCDRCGTRLRRRRRVWPFVAVGLLVVVAAAAVIVLLTRPGERPVARSPSPAASVTPGGISPSPVYRSQSTTLVLQLWDVGPISDDCDVNSFRQAGRPLLGSYLDECRSWERDGRPVHLYNVSLINRSDTVFDFEMRNFLVEDREGTLHRADPALATTGSDMPATRALGPEGTVGGWLIVPEEEDFVPSAVIYRAPGGEVRIEFQGRHEVRSSTP